MFDMSTRVMHQAAPGFPLSAQEIEPSRPNIIVMMADDMGWGDIDAPGFSVRAGLNPDDTEVRYQGTTFWETPNLVAMASDGLKFSRMYSQSPVCSPTRASVMTGRHPERMGIPFANRGKLENREITIAEYAQTLGYTTGMFGKWHLGSMTRDVNDSNRGGPGSFGVYSFPTDNGFDELYATESKTNTYNPLQLNPVTRYWTDPGVSVPFTIDSVINPVILGDDSAIIARETMSFMEQAVSDGEPFLSVVWFHTPHKPVTSPSAPTNSLGAYITSMQDLDTAVGQIRDQVQTLGIADNTILMFTSDNGPEDDQDWNGDVPLRANKRELFEGGLRVPGLIEWPGKIAPGETHTPMVTTDILPTLLDIWGIAPADDRPLDGQSMVTTIFDDRQAEREKTLVFRSTNGHRSALGFNGRYKLISTNNGGRWELYDIVYDFDENDPIANDGNIDEQPAEIQQVYNVLLTELQDRFASMDISLSGNITGDFETRVSNVSGITLQTEPPENLSINARENSTPELFIERQYATLREPVDMNSDGSPGMHDLDGVATLSAGNVVHSYLVHYDPTVSSPVDFEVTFADKIVGVLGAPNLLPASDALSFAHPNFEPERGLSEDVDSWMISNDGHTISFSFTAEAEDPAEVQRDIITVQESITVVADGTVVPVDGNGNIDSSGFNSPEGPLNPTSGLTWQYGIRERSNSQQLDRRAYSFLSFDISSMTADPSDPNFSATFTVDYQGHLNTTNGGFDVVLGQVSSAWDTSAAPNIGLSTGSTSLGTLVAGVENQAYPRTGLTLDITALVRGWADGSIVNNGLTFTSNQNVSQAAYFSNATIVTSNEQVGPASPEIREARILTESSIQFVPVVVDCLLGDVNGDGAVDFLDISPFISLLSTGGFSCEADIDGNGEVDFLDITPFIRLLSGS